MKKMIYLVFILFVLVATLALVANSKEKTETQKYELVYQNDNFEIRFYPQAIFATVEMNGDYFESRNGGFNVLAGYIFGNNKNNEKITMTSPVRISGENGVSEMSFVLPSAMEYEILPERQHNNVVLLEAQAVYMASLEFGGYANKNEMEM